MNTEHRDRPPSLNYSPDPNFVVNLKDILTKEYLVLVRNFPPDKNIFTSFSGRLGSLMPNYRAKGNNSADNYVQEVRIRTDILAEERLSTERDGELKPHTAKSWGITRPELFGLLMIDPGWRDLPFGNNGESILVRWGEVFLEMSKRFPENYQEDWQVLKGTKVSFTATHLKDPPASEPLITELSSSSDVGVRYKENMTDVIKKLLPNLPNGERYYQAILRFEEVARTTTARYEFPMETGDLYIVDNRRVGHARRSFEAYRTNLDGQLVYNPRYAVNIHILNVND